MRRLVTAPSGARVDTEAVFDAARAVGNHAEAHAGAGAEATTSWFRVADGYSAPETQQLLGSMEPVRTASESFSTAAQAVARALTTFAIEAEAAEARRARAATSIASFRTVAKGDDSWQQDPALVAQNSVLTSEVAAAEQELCEAEEACARAIASIPVDAPAFDTSTATVPWSVPAGTGGWGYPDEVFDVVLNPFFFWGMKPEEVTAWWNTVPAESQAIFIASFPALIGNKDGIPAKVRDQANRLHLASIRDALQADLDYWTELEERVPEFILVDKAIGLPGGGQYWIRNPEWNEEHTGRLDAARARVMALGSIDEVLSRESDDSIPRYLLVADLQGASPRAAVAVGEVDGAEHVGVLVSGTGTTVANGLAKSDTAARGLLAEASRQGSPQGSVAVVSWLDYEAPRLLTDAASRHYASEGAPSLVKFTQGLDATSTWTGGGAAGPHVTVLGHSYGAVVTGDAASVPGSKIDDVVVYGAPGVGKAPAEGVGRYSMLTSDDPIRHYHRGLAWTNSLGGIPYDETSHIPHLGSFTEQRDGWNQIPIDGGVTPDGVERNGSNGHSEYLWSGTRSQYNLANIIIGLPERAGFGDDVS